MLAAHAPSLILPKISQDDWSPIIGPHIFKLFLLLAFWIFQTWNTNQRNERDEIQNLSK